MYITSCIIKFIENIKCDFLYVVCVSKIEIQKREAKMSVITCKKYIFYQQKLHSKKYDTHQIFW